MLRVDALSRVRREPRHETHGLGIRRLASLPGSGQRCKGTQLQQRVARGAAGGLLVHQLRPTVAGLEDAQIECPNERRHCSAVGKPRFVRHAVEDAPSSVDNASAAVGARVHGLQVERCPPARVFPRPKYPVVRCRIQQHLAHYLVEEEERSHEVLGLAGLLHSEGQPRAA
eukprot:scaffold84739_cov69-Phaeocystis_antarctica.AAC.4